MSTEAMIRCPACDQTLAYGPSIAGQTIICPTCQRRLRMPTAGRQVVDLGHAQAFEPAGKWSPPGGQATAVPSASTQENPYAPRTALPGPSGKPADRRINYVLPGVFLAVLSGLGLFALGLNLIRVLLVMAVGGMLPGPAQMLFMLVFMALAGLSHGATFIGGMQMIRQRRLDLAKLGAFAALYPCGFCFILQIPFAIWALVILNQRSAVADFASRSDSDTWGGPAPRQLP